MAPGACEPPVAFYTPLPQERDDIKPGSLRRRAKRLETEPDAVKEWRKRMATEEGEAKMRKRKRIKLTNAHVKAKGLARLVLRGLAKVQATAVLAAIASNAAAMPQAKRFSHSLEGGRDGA